MIKENWKNIQMGGTSNSFTDHIVFVDGLVNPMDELGKHCIVFASPGVDTGILGTEFMLEPWSLDELHTFYNLENFPLDMTRWSEDELNHLYWYFGGMTGNFTTEDVKATRITTFRNLIYKEVKNRAEMGDLFKFFDFPSPRSSMHLVARTVAYYPKWMSTPSTTGQQWSKKDFAYGSADFVSYFCTEEGS